MQLKRIFISLAMVTAVSQVDGIAKGQHQIQSDSGMASGIVMDIHNASVPGAVITFESKLNGKRSKRKVESNGDGVFEIELPVGKYKVTVNISGYQKSQRKDLVIEAGKTTSFNIVLKENPRRSSGITE